jgi:gluconolactonase
MIYKWKEQRGISVFMKPSGYTGIGTYSGEPGSNGLTLDKQGNLILCEHGDRRIARNEGKRTVADNYQGKRFNSPNDVVVKSNGDIYFTDPPYGLPKPADDPKRETDFFGIYRIGRDGKVTLRNKEMSRPNGLAFSPDEKILYLAQSDPQKAIWMAFPVLEDGTLGKGKVFFDDTPLEGRFKGLPDGLKVDQNENVFATALGGVNIFVPTGTWLGLTDIGEGTANCAWGEDGTVLYITANMYRCHIRTTTKGAGW